MADFVNNVYKYKLLKRNAGTRKILEHKKSPLLLIINFFGAIPFGIIAISPFLGIFQLVKMIRIAQYQSVWNKRAVSLADYQKPATDFINRVEIALF